MLFDRHKRLLALLSALGDELGSRDFQKLLFLFCTEVERTPTYEFVPYKFGCFSFTSYADKRKLVREGCLVDEENTWRLTPKGRMGGKVGKSTEESMEAFAIKHARLRGEALVAEVYRRHPYYAIRSEIAHGILKDDGGTLNAIEEARPKKREAKLLTLGYEGRSLEAFLNVLLKSSVTLLCDVRRNPLSRKYGFSKSTLSTSCEKVGVRYEHLPQLGIASDERRGLETQSDYDALFECYEKQSLPRQEEALEHIGSWVKAGHRVVLTCYEHLPEQCHRHCVAEALEDRFGKGFVPENL